MYKWHQVRVMRSKGVGIKKIARSLGLSKNTVRKYLRGDGPPQFNTRKYESMLSQYEGKIEEMMEKHYIGTRIYAELAGMGFTGSLATVHRYVRNARKDADIREKQTTRVETPPGKQMQYDWKEWDLPVGGRAVKIYIHEVVLSYSRKKYYVSSLSITTSDVIRAITEAIHFFGGMAAELVIDNPKQMVIIHEKDSVVRYNDDFLKFCGLYGIEPNPCANYRARTKGKAERPFYYLQEHLLRGLEVADLSEFDLKLREFTDAYNNRPHSALKESPEARFLREQDRLSSIPLVDTSLLFSKDIKPVSNDGYISYSGGFYSVPMRFCLRSVLIEPVFGKFLYVYDDGGRLVTYYHINLFETGIRPDHPEHAEINRGFVEKKKAVRAEIVKSFIGAFDDKGRIYIDMLRENVSANVYWHLKEIMKYVDIYGVDTVSEVISECIEIGTYHKNSVKRLLVKRKLNRPSPLPYKDNPVALPLDIRRGLASYRVEVPNE